jgi:choline dehydrogenase-like flavoprotein
MVARRLPHKDAVIIGLGWTGSILGHELCDAGLETVAIERALGGTRPRISRPIKAKTSFATASGKA